MGGGAYLGGQRLQVSQVKQLSQALVAASFPAGVQIEDPSIDDFIRVMVACQAVRRMGSAALNLSYVASGRMDGYWAMATKIWDVAAGVLLVSEAGGLVTAPDGSPLDLARPQFVCTSTPELHAELSGKLGQGRVR